MNRPRHCHIYSHLSTGFHAYAHSHDNRQESSINEYVPLIQQELKSRSNLLSKKFVLDIDFLTWTGDLVDNIFPSIYEFTSFKIIFYLNKQLLQAQNQLSYMYSVYILGFTSVRSSATIDNYHKIFWTSVAKY